MKSQKSLAILALGAIATLTSLIGAQPAEAQMRDRYYTRETVTHCHNQGRNTAIGLGVGLGLGLLLGDGDTGAAVAGAAVGGVLGFGLSCEQETVYLESVDDQLSDREYFRPRERRGVRVIILESGFNRRGEVCRTYHSEFRTRRGWVSRVETACFVRGHGWRHGYDRGVIRDRRFRAERPPIQHWDEDDSYYEEEGFAPSDREMREQERLDNVAPNDSRTRRQRRSN